MKLLRVDKRRYINEVGIVGYNTIYVVDQLPKEEELITLGNKSGYVVSVQFEEEDKYYCVYLEKHLGDYYNQVAEISDVVLVDLKEE